MNSNTISSCENSPIFNTTRNYTIITCATISGISFIIYIPLLIVHLANIRKMTFISSFNFQMLLSSILHSVTFFVQHFNQYLFRCGTKGPLNMIAILLSVGIATNISYISFNTLWNVKLTTSPPTYMKAILLIFGLIIPITFPILLIAIRAIFDRDTQITDVKCWNESNTLQHVYNAMAFAYYLISFCFLVRCIYKLRKFYGNNDEQKSTAYKKVFRQLWLYLVMICLYFGFHIYTFVQYYRERTYDVCIDNFWLVFLWLGTESLQSPIFAVVFGSKANMFGELKQILTHVFTCSKGNIDTQNCDGSLMKELDQSIEENDNETEEQVNRSIEDDMDDD